MNPNTALPVGIIAWVAAVVVALVYIALTSQLAEPSRRHFNAIIVAGAGAVYLGGGLGISECAFTVLATFLAYQGLRSYSSIGAAWLLHTGWDVVHHLYGKPIVPFLPTSSIGCAICDPVIAAWCFMGARPIFRRSGSASTEGAG